MKLVLMFFLLLVVLSPHAYAYDTAVAAAELSCPTFEERRLSSKLIKRFHESRRLVPLGLCPRTSPVSSCLSNNNASF